MRRIVCSSRLVSIARVTLPLFIFLCVAASAAQAQTFFDPKEKKDNKESRKPPVVKNLQYRDDRLYLEAQGSQIKAGALLWVNGEENFQLGMDESGAYIMVDRETKSSNNRKISQAIPPKTTVSITVVNPDGQRSDAVSFSR